MAGRGGQACTALLLHHRGRAAEPDGLPRRLGLVLRDCRRRTELRNRSNVTNILLLTSIVTLLLLVLMTSTALARPLRKLRPGTLDAATR